MTVYNSHMQKITIGPNNSLSARIFKSEPEARAFPAVLFVHGWKTDQQGLAVFAERLAELGFICMTFDLPGHGESAGDRDVLSRQDFFTNVLAAYDFLASLEDVDAGRMYAVGASFGAYLVALLAAERNVQGLVMRVPSNYPDEGFTQPKLRASGDTGVDDWRKLSLPWNETASLRALHGFSGPVLMVESGQDAVIPHQAVQNYVDALPDQSVLTYKIMENAPHSLGNDELLRQEYADLLQEWFSKIKKS